MANSTDNLVLEQLRLIRETLKTHDRHFEEARRELRALNIGMKGILNLLDSHQEIGNLQSVRMDTLDMQVERLMALEERVDRLETNEKTEH